MLKDKWTLLLIGMILIIALIGGLDKKKTVDVESNGQNKISMSELNK